MAQQIANLRSQGKRRGVHWVNEKAISPLDAKRRSVCGIDELPDSDKPLDKDSKDDAEIVKETANNGKPKDLVII